MHELNMVLADSVSNFSTIVICLFTFLLISETDIIIKFKIMHDLTALIQLIINNYAHNWEKNREGISLFINLIKYHKSIIL